MLRIFKQCLLALLLYIFSAILHCSHYALAANTEQLKLQMPLLAGELQAGKGKDIKAFGKVWKKLVPDADLAIESLELRGTDFNLHIDASRYPLYPTIDDGMIVLDQKNEIPPLIRQLVEEQTFKTRIVSPASDKADTTLLAMLTAGGFYSVEKQPLLVFGDDPKVIIQPDFKIEPAPDSITKNRIFLLHTGLQKSPAALVDFIEAQGLQMLEPFANDQVIHKNTNDRLVLLENLSPLQTADSLLQAFALPAENNYRLDLMEASKNGIGLSVIARRYFNFNNKPYIISEFDGDPVSYTLLRLLETEGYNVIFLDKNDNSGRAVTKILKKLNLPAKQSMQQLAAAPDNSYAVELSGVTVHGINGHLETIVFTERAVEQKLQELLKAHGFLIQEQVD